MVSLADDLALALDRREFARSVSFEPDEWQAEALRSEDPRQLYNASRQSGKSTVAAILAVHTALYEPGSLALLLSPTLRQSQELFKKCLGFYREAGRPVAPESETALTLTLKSGSRIVSLPGKEGTVRGYSGVRLLVIDEAARVADELYASVRPMLAVSAGRLVTLSTPFGTRGWWYEAGRGRLRLGALRGPRHERAPDLARDPRGGAPDARRVVVRARVHVRVPGRGDAGLQARGHRPDVR
jgi:Terminase large subunit, T4likevirus-type, N-terminal